MGSFYTSNFIYLLLMAVTLGSAGRCQLRNYHQKQVFLPVKIQSNVIGSIEQFPNEIESPVKMVPIDSELLDLEETTTFPESPKQEKSVTPSSLTDFKNPVQLKHAYKVFPCITIPSRTPKFSCSPTSSFTFSIISSSLSIFSRFLIFALTPP